MLGVGGVPILPRGVEFEIEVYQSQGWWWFKVDGVAITSRGPFFTANQAARVAKRYCRRLARSIKAERPESQKFRYTVED